MKKLAVLPLAALAFAAACADTPTSPSLSEAALWNETTVPTASGPVWVTGQFSYQITVPAGGIAPGINTHPQGFGSCRQANGVIDAVNPENNTTWFNPAGQWTNAPFCRGVEGNGAGPITVTCDLEPLAATYAFGGSGAPAPGINGASNENLNFVNNQAWEQADLFVHYNASRNRTTGAGILRVEFTCDHAPDGSADLDLNVFTKAGNQFLYVGPTSRKLSSVNLFPGIPLVLEWEYRSRNDIPPTEA